MAMPIYGRRADHFLHYVPQNDTSVTTDWPIMPISYFVAVAGIANASTLLMMGVG